MVLVDGTVGKYSAGLPHQIVWEVSTLLLANIDKLI